MVTAGIPGPLDNDPHDVRAALSAAQKLWGEEDRVEALRWLRRAAESASDAGDDLRSVALARAAADLRNASNITGSIPPAASGPPPADAVAAAQDRLSENPAQTVPATPAAGAAAALQGATQAAKAANAEGPAEAHPAASVAAAPAVAAAPPVVPAAAPEQQVQHLAGPETVDAPVEKPLSTATGLGVVPRPEGLEDSDAVAGAPASPSVTGDGQDATDYATAAEQAAAQAATAAPAVEAQAAAGGLALGAPAGPDSHQGTSDQTETQLLTHDAVRVMLGATPNESGQFVIQPLTPGQSAPAGWREAILLSPVPGSRLFPDRG